MTAAETPLLAFSFEAEVIHWRGPSPFFFVAVPVERAAEVRRVAARVSYGWGMIPVAARIGEVAFTTAMFPKDEGYLLPLKAEVRRRAGVTAGDRIRLDLVIAPAP